VSPITFLLAGAVAGITAVSMVARTIAATVTQARISTGVFAVIFCWRSYLLALSLYY